MWGKREMIHIGPEAGVFCSMGDKMAKRIPDNLITILAVLVLLLGMGLVSAKASPAFAEGEAALDVYQDDTCLHSFTMQELEDIAKAEGAQKYTFSGFNTYPTPKPCVEIEGPTVEGILETALEESGSGLEQIAGTQLIGFRASDGLEEKFMKDSLFTQRYYFPNFRQEQGRSGHAVLAESMADPVPVPAVISLREEGKAYGEEGRDEPGRLLFGQIVPNEQNHSMFVKYMVTGDKEKASMRGRITIYSRTAETLNAIATTDHGRSGALKSGTEIVLDRSVNLSHTEGGSRYWIYYTTDGTEPDMTSEMYNYNNNSFGQTGEKINFPAMAETDTMQLRVKVYGYDRLPSEISEFTFCQPLARPVMKKPALKGRTITVKWKAIPGAEGYQIVRATKKSGKYKTVKTIKNAKTVSWKNTKLKKGKTYYYKIRAYRTVAGKPVYSSYSAVKYKKVK